MLGDADRAIDDFNQAIKLAPDHVGALYSRGLEAIFADEANRKRFLSHGLRAAIDAMDRRTPKGDAPDLDFDPISSGNDPNFHDLRITVESEQAARAVVIADFVSHQDKVRTVLRYLLVRENDGWKIDDIIARGKNEWRVRKLIRGTAGK
jgi:hypothetical protein